MQIKLKQDFMSNPPILDWLVRFRTRLNAIFSIRRHQSVKPIIAFDGTANDAIGVRGPRTQVKHFAAFAAKWPPFVCDAVFTQDATLRTTNFGSGHDY
jgi:hypothetical protein